MKGYIKIISGVLIAYLLHVTLSKISLSFILLFNFLSLIVIYFGINKDEIYGACLGSFCGLIQDSFSLGVFGVAGLAKTITGFLAGYISKKVNVVPLSRCFVFIFILVSMEFILWALLYSFIFSENINTGKGLILFQPLCTALLGSFIFRLIKKLDKSSP